MAASTEASALAVSGVERCSLSLDGEIVMGISNLPYGPPRAVPAGARLPTQGGSAKLSVVD